MGWLVWVGMEPPRLLGSFGGSIARGVFLACRQSSIAHLSLSSRSSLAPLALLSRSSRSCCAHSQFSLVQELYIAFSFDFPFLLATIENGFFAPIALVAYMLAPAWLRVPKAHHHHQTTAAVLATEAHRDGALQVVPIDATVLRSTERRRTTTTSSGEEMLELVDFEPDYRQYYTISSAPTSLAPPTTSGRSSIVVVAPEVLLATPDPTAPTPDIPLPPSPPPPSASPSATTDFASYVWLVLPVGLALAAQFIFATWATLEAPISLLAVTKAAQPVLTAVFGFVLFSKRTSWPVCVILVALGAGSSLDLVSVRLADHVTTLGAVLAVMSAIATVMRSLLAERAMSDYSSLTLMLLANPVSFALCLATFLASGELSGVLSYTWTVSVVLYVCMQAVFESILLLLALAVIEYTSAVSQAVTVAAVRPASTILGVVFFSEVLTLLSIVGMLITFGASFLYALAKWPAFTAWLSTYF